MPSQSLSMWFNEARQALDELEVAHRAVGGRGPGRRFATLQVNRAYAVLLSSQFQRFCRDLHSEAVDALTILVPNADLRDIFRAQLTAGRKLDSGNPNPGNIGSDFGRLGMDFWTQVRRAHPQNAPPTSKPRKTQSLAKRDRTPRFQLGFRQRKDRAAGPRSPALADPLQCAGARIRLSGGQAPDYNTW